MPPAVGRVSTFRHAPIIAPSRRRSRRRRRFGDSSHHSERPSRGLTKHDHDELLKWSRHHERNRPDNATRRFIRRAPAEIEWNVELFTLTSAVLPHAGNECRGLNGAAMPVPNSSRRTALSWGPFNVPVRTCNSPSKTDRSSQTASEEITRNLSSPGS